MSINQVDLVEIQQQTQQLVTKRLTKLYDIDIGGTIVKLSDSDYAGYHTIEIEMSGIRSDLTGSIAEPSLTIACKELWNTNWATATQSFTSLGDYKGVKVQRRRVFEGGADFLPQVFYIKSVDEFDAFQISFTLTPMLGGDRLDLPSARKLEL